MSMPGTVLRYCASASGPVAVSAAHFLASLIFLHSLPAREFGLLSFVMVVVSFGMSLNVSLISVPLTRILTMGEAVSTSTCFQMNWLICTGSAAALFAALLAGGAPFQEALLLGLYAGGFTFRWFARCFAYVDGRMAAAVQSDLTYSLFLIASLGILAIFGGATFTRGSEMLLLSALAALLPFGLGFFRTQVAALYGNPKRYWPVFRDVTRWSLSGVILTELTVNAHAYFVTFIAGPSAFALLALGTLLVRPASLMQSALTDLERPAMARAIAANDSAALSRIARHFHIWSGSRLGGEYPALRRLAGLLPRAGGEEKLQHGKCHSGGIDMRLRHGDPRHAYAARGLVAGRRPVQAIGEHRYDIGRRIAWRDAGLAADGRPHRLDGRHRAG
jgi:hypothetical protein